MLTVPCSVATTGAFLLCSPKGEHHARSLVHGGFGRSNTRTIRRPCFQDHRERLRSPTEAGEGLAPASPFQRHNRVSKLNWLREDLFRRAAKNCRGGGSHSIGPI